MNATRLLECHKDDSGAFEYVAIPEDAPPILIVIIDTEEEFDWDLDFNRLSRAVTNIYHQDSAMKIFAHHGLCPAYAIDYSVLEDKQALKILDGYLQSGQAVIGAHLHPWVTPPYQEVVNAFNSFACNLPYELEFEKISKLTDKLKSCFGIAPRFYRAGRYGIGVNTGNILEKLGYHIDSSVYPTRDYSGIGGNNFYGYPAQPYWFKADSRKLLELPLTAGFTGCLKKYGENILPKIKKVPGISKILSTTCLFDHAFLTPEGMPLAQAINLTNCLLKAGHKVFILSYHSSSLAIGGTPYVRNEEEKRLFLKWIDDYLKFFSRLGGEFSTPLAFYEQVAVSV